MSRRKRTRRDATRPRSPGLLWSDAATFAAGVEGQTQRYGLLRKIAEARIGLDLAFKRLHEAERRRATAHSAKSWKKRNGQERFATPEDFDLPQQDGLVLAGHVVLALRERGISQVIETQLELIAEAYALCLFAHMFWTSAEQLKERVSVDGFDPAWRAAEQTRKQAKHARDHVAHLAERITRGREQRFGAPMTVDDFLASPGSFDGTNLTFADESFDLAGVVHGIRNLELAVLPPLIRQLAAEAHEEDLASDKD